MPLDYTSQSGENFPVVRHNNSVDSSGLAQPVETLAGPGGEIVNADEHGLHAHIKKIADALLVNGNTTGSQPVIAVILARPEAGGAVSIGSNDSPVYTNPTENPNAQLCIAVEGTFAVDQGIPNPNLLKAWPTKLVDFTGAEVTESGRAKVNPIVGQIGIDGGAGATTAKTQRVVLSEGGSLNFRSLDLDESEEQVSAVPVVVKAIHFTNTFTATRWLKLYNATAANVTVGTTVPVYTIGLPGNATDDISGALPFGLKGMTFSTALCAAATTGVADSDTGAPGANEVIVNILYDTL